ncbi:MAG TPA: hypothetical protein VEW46_13995 [Pyrinomonadaceae bacterium]|nr:hypothetical protein [Pyrinomonadaceae bacterium]
MTENTPKTKSVGVIKTDKLAKVAVWKDYAKAAQDAAAARQAQQDAKSKLKEYLVTKLDVAEKDALDFTVEGSTVRVFINLVEKNPRKVSNAGLDLSDKF